MILCLTSGDSIGSLLISGKNDLGLTNEDFKIYEIDQLNKNSDLYENMILDLEKASGLIMHFHGSAAHLKGLAYILEKITDKKLFFSCSIPEELEEMLKRTNLSLDQYQKLYKYFSYGGKDNIKEFIKLFFNIAEGRDYKIADLKKSKQYGIYYKNKIVENEESYIKNLLKANKKIVGILINVSYVKTGNTKHIDRLIEVLESKNLGVLTIFARMGPDRDKGIYGAMKDYFYFDGCLIIDSIIALNGYSISTFYNGKDRDFDLSLFENFDLPVFQGITIFLSREDFIKDPQGLDFAALSVSVYQPEMDGQIITIPIATSEYIEENGITIKEYRPLEDRVERLANLVAKTIGLRNKENSKKKIALILHNYPPRNDMIGSAHGLDTPASLFNILKELKIQGYKLENNFSNGQEIIDSLLARGTNDWSFIDEKTLVENAVYRLREEEYKDIFYSLEKTNQDELIAAWANPPGKTMVINKEQIIPGILDGNIFIGLQPKRSSNEDLEESYHSLKLPPPHSYIGFYRWIEEIFEADAVVHIGTHGTIEWLPGKEVGQAQESYPDINIGSLPHLYIYNLGILGEGMQVRRRTHGTILSHLIPSFDESGTYEYLEEFEDLERKLDHAKNSSPSQVAIIEEEILSLAKRENILKDLKINEDSKDVIKEIHNYVHLIKNSITRDGLHIYGYPPEKKRFNQLVRGLAMIGQANTLGLKDGIISSLGYSYEEINDQIRDLTRDNGENYRILERASEISKDLIEKWSADNFALDKTPALISAYNFKNTTEVERTLKFIGEEIVIRLEKTDDEIKALVKGLDGNFILPSLGGNPTRGNIFLLPTGRNFYSIKPEAIPTKEAYKIGKKLADIQLESYYKEKGSYPKSLAIIIYSTNTMKTYGEDIGEILYLMGLKPKYLGSTEVVSGLEVIDPKVLGRPRVDVTLRVSGLFRDTFPNLINLMDQALDLVISLDEPEEINPIKAHVLKDLERLMDADYDQALAREIAKTRVYSAPAGTYGAGVADLIESKDWESLDDLAAAYITWSSHGYNKNFHGYKMEDQMQAILKRTTMTIKNEVSKEIDLLDSDDFYNYHGGLIAAVKSQSGQRPIIEVGNTANPDFIESRNLDLETSRIIRSRILNPKWLEGLKDHGYKGAAEISKAVDIIFGWDATAESIEDWVYDGIADRFLLDDETLKWIEKYNKAAAYQISERLLEANKRNMWQADEERIEKIRQIYLQAEGNLEEG